MAGNMDARPQGQVRMALLRRGGHHGVLPQAWRAQHPGKCLLGQRQGRQRLGRERKTLHPFHRQGPSLGNTVPCVAHGLGKGLHPHLPGRRTAQRDRPQQDHQRQARPWRQPLPRPHVPAPEPCHGQHRRQGGPLRHAHAL